MRKIFDLQARLLRKAASKVYRLFLKNYRYDIPSYASREDTEAPFGCLNRYDILKVAFQFTYGNIISGDYFEFGCWTARTFRMAHELSRRPYLMGGGASFHKAIHLYAFDSFQGLPELSDIDKDKKWKSGDFATGYDDFIAILKKHGISEKDYTIVKGFYQETLNKDLQDKMDGVKAAVVFIDCDIYESTKDALSFLVPFLQNGTIVCFDDYLCYQGNPNKGEQRALSEFLDANPSINFNEWYNFGWHGKSFIVEIKE